MLRGTVNICNVPTEIITYNGWIDDNIALSRVKDVVVIITGTLGVPAFFQEFAEQLRTYLPKGVPIWIIGHAGHIKPPSDRPLFYPHIKTHPYLYDLEGNVKHKVEFIRKYAPTDAKLHIIAHSIGCWFALNLLDDKEISGKVQKCYMLFPTIEHLAETPTGLYVSNYVLKMSNLILFLATMFSVLPRLVQVTLLKPYEWWCGFSRGCRDAFIQLIHPVSLSRVFLLLKDQLAIVKELDDTVITKNEKKLFMYYGDKDGWTPSHFIMSLMDRYPNIRTCCCWMGLRHLFFLRDKSAAKMAKLVGNMLERSIALRDMII